MINATHENKGTINKNMVSIKTDKGHIELYFSYETIVSFRLSTYGQNAIYDNATTSEYFSRTTSKFINELEPNKERRINPTEFNTRLERALNLLSINQETLTAQNL